MARFRSFTRYGVEAGVQIKEVLFFKEYEIEAEAPQFAHTPPNQTGLWVFAGAANALFDIASIISAFTIAPGTPNESLEIPLDHPYWKPLGTHDEAFAPLPLRPTVALSTQAAYEAYLAANPG